MTVPKLGFNEKFNSNSLFNSIHKEQNTGNGTRISFVEDIVDMLNIYKHFIGILICLWLFWTGFQKWKELVILIPPPNCSPLLNSNAPRN